MVNHGRHWSTLVDDGRPRSTIVDHGYVLDSVRECSPRIPKLSTTPGLGFARFPLLIVQPRILPTSTVARGACDIVSFITSMFVSRVTRLTLLVTANVPPYTISRIITRTTVRRALIPTAITCQYVLGVSVASMVLCIFLSSDPARIYVALSARHAMTPSLYSMVLNQS